MIKIKVEKVHDNFLKRFQFTKAWEQYAENYCFVYNTYWVRPDDDIPESLDTRFDTLLLRIGLEIFETVSGFEFIFKVFLSEIR